jgi:organic radical activating enzyme
MNKPVTIDKLEFYITNVCNLTCSGCNRYNNYKFAGWQDWTDYADIIQQWSKKINLIKPVILGGEPLLNPSINDWVRGITAAWPKAYSPEIISNGTRVDLTPGLYDACSETSSWIGISIHRDADRETIYRRIRNFLTEPVSEGPALRTDMNSDYQFIDKNNVQVHIWNTTDFLQSNIIERIDGTRTLYNSDPIKAHSVCPQVAHKNYHMIKGKIYKCGPVALMPEFDQQYPLDITDEDRVLLHSGKGLSIEEFDEHGEEFFANIDKPIPQCKFCPTSWSWHPIEFSTLKPNKI